MHRKVFRGYCMAFPGRVFYHVRGSEGLSARCVPTYRNSCQKMSSTSPLDYMQSQQSIRRCTSWPGRRLYRISMKHELSKYLHFVRRLRFVETLNSNRSLDTFKRSVPGPLHASLYQPAQYPFTERSKATQFLHVHHPECLKHCHTSA